MNTRILKKLDNLEKGYKELCNSNSANNFVHLKNLEVIKEMKELIKENWEANQELWKLNKKTIDGLQQINKGFLIAITELQNKIDKK
jgi:hypothetical protein